MGKRSKTSGTSSGGSGGGGGGDAKHEQPFQAVLLAADIFEEEEECSLSNPFGGSSGISGGGGGGGPVKCRRRNGFAPLELDRPKVLCPLNNRPMILYALDFLAGAGVEQVFVVCTSEQVERYLQQHHNSSDNGHNNTMTVTVIRDSFLNNAGDALRELDKQNLVQSDPFLLVWGDVVTNVDVQPALAAHKLRRQRDSSAMMTMLLKSVGSVVPSPYLDIHNATPHPVVQYSPLRPHTDDLIVAVDPTQDYRILLYTNQRDDTSISIPCSFFAAHPAIDVRVDLIDVGINVCSPDVLARFSDEFDYGDIRRQFVSNSVAEEEEGLQNKLFAHLIPTQQYAARIHDFATYHAVSRDLLQRWAYPIVPNQSFLYYHPPPTPKYDSDDDIEDGDDLLREDNYMMQRHYLYLAQGHGTAHMGRTSTLTGPGMMGHNCHLGEGCCITRSVLGHYCSMGDGVTITDSHIWDHVQISSGAVIQQSILAHGVIVQAGAIIERGCVLGAGVVVGENARVPAFSRLTLVEPEQDDINYDWGDDDDRIENDNVSSDDEASDDKKEESSHDSNKENAASQKVIGDLCRSEVVGPTGKGRLWSPALESDDSDYDENDDDDDQGAADCGPIDLAAKRAGRLHDIHAQCLGFDPTILYLHRMARAHQEDQDGVSDDEEMLENLEQGLDEYADGAVTFGVPGMNTADSDDGLASMRIKEPIMIIGRQEGVDVIQELKAICLEYEYSSPIENLAIELNSYKFSQNATYSDCTMAATLAMMEHPHHDMMHITKGMSPGKLVAEFKAQLEHWSPLLQKMSIGIDEEKAIILALERCAAGKEGEDMDDIQDGSKERRKDMRQVLSSGMAFRLLLQTLHDEEVVSGEAVLAWAADRKEEAKHNPQNPRIQLFQMQSIQDFITWLEEESDEDDDEDEEDDGSDE